MDYGERVAAALEVAAEHGCVGEAHHKAWVVDQMVRALTGCPVVELDSRVGFRYFGRGESDEYRSFVAGAAWGAAWDAGVAP